MALKKLKIILGSKILTEKSLKIKSYLLLSYLRYLKIIYRVKGGGEL